MPIIIITVYNEDYIWITPYENFIVTKMLPALFFWPLPKFLSLSSCCMKWYEGNGSLNI